MVKITIKTPAHIREVELDNDKAGLDLAAAVMTTMDKWKAKQRALYGVQLAPDPESAYHDTDSIVEG